MCENGKKIGPQQATEMLERLATMRNGSALLVQEAEEAPYDKLVRAANLILEAIGEDLTRPGLLGTPDRIARMWLEFANYNPGKLETTFNSIEADQMVVVTGMQVWSFCEHHLLPFDCTLSIGYITGDKVLGLSKFARIAHKHAHKLQIQERLVRDIADEVKSITGTESVAVLGSGTHGCMAMRGIRTPHKMVSSVMDGKFRSEESTRAEFLKITGLS
jgi:GTP cyclohydrolase I